MRMKMSNSNDKSHGVDSGSSSHLAHVELFTTEFELSLNDDLLLEFGHDSIEKNDGDISGEIKFHGQELQFQDDHSVLKKIDEKGDEDVLKSNIQSHDTFSSVLVDELLIKEIQAIPDRFGFKIGDVADLLGIKQYVLRYWEQEFELLKPKKAQNNQRFYTRKDVENAFLIRKLLYRDKFSIEGARRALKEVKNVVKKEIDKEKDISQLSLKLDHIQEQIKNFILDIRKTKNFFNP